MFTWAKFLIFLWLPDLNSSPTVNRRMDEWIPVSRIDMKRGVVEETPKEIDTMLELNGRERKVTRNLKRKHDEINHIQKVPHFLARLWYICVGGFFQVAFHSHFI